MTKAPNVPAVDRALRALELLAQSTRGFTIGDLSRRLELPRSSVHLILTTLERRGYARRHPQNGHFCVGPKLAALSGAPFEAFDLREQARPLLATLMRQTKLTIHLGVLEGNEVVIVEKVTAPATTRVLSWVGRRMEPHATGLGKALIAYLPEDELDKLISMRGLPRHNHRTITDGPQLKSELASVRQRGFSLDDEEDELGYRCVGAPILDAHQRAVAAVSIVGTTSEIALERVAILAVALRRTTADLSAQLA
jgi:DNA-binding IclR family transcriptional regulator